MNKFIANLVCLFVKDRNSRKDIRAFFARNKISPLRPFARLALPRMLPPEFHNAIVFKLEHGLADQIKTVALAKCFYDNWRGKKPTIIINVGGLVSGHKGTKIHSADDPWLQGLLKSTKRKYDPSGKKLISTAFELGPYKIDWSWVAGFAILPGDIKKKYNLFGRYYNLSRAQIKKNPFAMPNPEQKIVPPALVRCFPEFDLFDLPCAAEFVKSLKFETTGANKAKQAEVKKTRNSICVHVRRGDYIAHKGGLTLPASYFEKSIREIVARAGWKNATLFVFSDDWDWAIKVLNFTIPGIKLTTDFVRINDISDPAPELELMRTCRHFVISVGGFAHMAYEMSASKDKILIKPEKKDFISERNHDVRTNAPQD